LARSIGAINLAAALVMASAAAGAFDDGKDATGATPERLQSPK
jgi:hypothetical protein